MIPFLQQLRIHQWVKNILIALPLILAHRVADGNAVIAVITSVVVFCLIASAVYTFNDLVDADSDAQHPDKRHRPIPSGRLPRNHAIMMLTGLTIVGMTVAILTMPSSAVIWMGVYVALNVIYSLWLRGKVILDVLLLGLFYTLRLILGGAVANVPLSPWLLSFSMFLFMSLAFVKRHAELIIPSDKKVAASNGRGYQPADASFILTIGSTLGFIAILVFVLYLNSPEIRLLYKQPDRLWLLVPMMIYWISYLWLMAHRGKVHADPVVFMLRDKTSYVTACLACVVYLWAWL